MSVIFLLTAISFVIINILFNCYRYSQQMMAIHTSPLCMYICSSFQIIKSNSSLFENRLALITYWSNRMHQTWYFGNSQTRSLKKRIFCVCQTWETSSCKPDTMYKPKPHREAGPGYSGGQHELTVPTNSPECKGSSLLEVQPNLGMWWFHSELPSDCNFMETPKRQFRLRARIPQTVRNNNKLWH